MPTDGEGLPPDVNVGGMDRLLLDSSRLARLDERAAIVAFLRRQAPTLLRHVIDAIECGEHARS